MTHMIEDV